MQKTPTWLVVAVLKLTGGAGSQGYALAAGEALNLSFWPL